MDYMRDAIHQEVAKAVAPIAHLETTWSEQEIVKRIVRYISKAASSTDLYAMPWEQGTRALIETAMQGYSAACQDKDWFFEIELAPAFGVAAWEIVRAKGRPNIPYPKLQALVLQEYEESLDGVLLTRALIDGTHQTFQNEAVSKKVYNALQKTYQPALDEVLADQTVSDDLQRVERFTRKWVEDSMQRAWAAIDGGATMNEEKVTQLFRNLVAPYGDKHPFSCIPGVLTERIGRPPREWQFIGQMVKELFEAWQQGISTTKAAKRRKTESWQEWEYWNGGAPAVTNTHDSWAATNNGAHMVPPDSRDAVEVERPSAEPEGHPECTSEEDCIGKPSHRLVRHMLGSDPGDLYCEVCWDSFMGQNPRLEGMLIETGTPYLAK